MQHCEPSAAAGVVDTHVYSQFCSFLNLIAMRP